jgi:anhydro-N-acetylmuramic acid kinase
MPKKYRVIGIMSGTSCDGLDIALCHFTQKGNGWSYEIDRAITVPYSKEWKEALQSASKLSGLDLLKLHNDYGTYIGEQVKKFTKGSNKNIDFISSHGHTVFHQPAKGLTFQIGSGACIASVNTLTTVCDFRTLDVALHGQGAPLVPLGDMQLFPDYYYCLNLGGFANISYNWHNKRVAYDICPVNIALNYLAQKKGQDYDKDGAMAEKGQLNQKMLGELNSLKYYSKKYPKSLSREWLESEFLPILEKYQVPVEDKIRTVCEHISMQLAQAVKSPVMKKILITGGGALNKFLIRLFKQQTKQLIIIPNDNLINYKEALIFAYLGLLRYRYEPNCLSSVTGSRLNHAGGVIFRI